MIVQSTLPLSESHWVACQPPSVARFSRDSDEAETTNAAHFIKLSPALKKNPIGLAA